MTREQLHTAEWRCPVEGCCFGCAIDSTSSSACRLIAGEPDFCGVDGKTRTLKDNVPEGKNIPTSNIGRGGGTRPGNAFELPGSSYGERDNDDSHTSELCKVLPSYCKVVLRTITSGNFYGSSGHQVGEECDLGERISGGITRISKRRFAHVPGIDVPELSLQPLRAIQGPVAGIDVPEMIGHELFERSRLFYSE